jgi:AsmA-like C-terminal region
VVRRVLIGLVIVVALAALGIYWFFSGDGVRVALEHQASAWLGQPVHIGRATVSFVPRIGLRLTDVSVGETPRLTLSRVDLSTGLRPLLSQRIEDAELIVRGSRVEMPLPFGLAAHSAASATSRAAAVGGAGITVVSIREITFRDVVIASRGREITVSADSSFNGDQLTMASLTARSGDTMLSASGTLTMTPRPTATIEATANELDFDDLLALAAAFTSETSSAGAAGTPAQITATLTAPRARLAGVALSRFEASLLADGTEVRIEPLKFDVFGGRHDGWLDVTFGEMLNVRMGAGVSNLDVSQLAAYGSAANTITGRLYGSGRFAARGRDMAEVLAAARGVGEVMLSDGTIPHLDVVRTVVLYFGRPAEDAPPASGERFDSIGATFALSDRVVRSDDLTLRSPDFDVFARGTLALPTRMIDARAELVLSERLSAQAGRDLYRFTRSGNRIVLPAIITGTLDQPRVRIDTAAAVRRGLQNEIERRLEDLLERVRPRLP